MGQLGLLIWAVFYCFSGKKIPQLNLLIFSLGTAFMAPWRTWAVWVSPHLKFLSFSQDQGGFSNENIQPRKILYVQRPWQNSLISLFSLYYHAGFPHTFPFWRTSLKLGFRYLIQVSRKIRLKKLCNIATYYKHNRNAVSMKTVHIEYR